MDDEIFGKVNPITSGKDNLSIRPEHTDALRQRNRRNAGARQGFKGLLKKIEEEMTGKVLKKNGAKTKNANGRRIP
ncbi:MAG TPA: hypothetical protein P5511_01145 [Candidatus Goldiibacteriota bacterium]|nr:hypothetical protein [Candidatus Goldiibacteriota bacterium]